MDQNLSKDQIRLDIPYHEIKSTGQKDRKCVIERPLENSKILIKDHLTLRRNSAMSTFTRKSFEN